MNEIAHDFVKKLAVRYRPLFTQPNNGRDRTTIVLTKSTHTHTHTRQVPANMHVRALTCDASACVGLVRCFVSDRDFQKSWLSCNTHGARRTKQFIRQRRNESWLFIASGSRYTQVLRFDAKTLQCTFIIDYRYTLAHSGSGSGHLKMPWCAYGLGNVLLPSLFTRPTHWGVKWM